MNRILITVVAAVGLFGTVPMVGAIATADPATSTSPGVPCLDIVQQLAASPAEIQQPLASAATSLVSAPLADAAGIVPPPAVPVIPDVGALASMLPSALPLPSVPGLPVPLPQAVSLPHDLICAGTAWSALKSGAGGAAPVKAEVGRRDW
jgi:hypothetical protein